MEHPKERYNNKLAFFFGMKHNKHGHALFIIIRSIRAGATADGQQNLTRKTSMNISYLLNNTKLPCI